MNKRKVQRAIPIYARGATGWAMHVAGIKGQDHYYSEDGRKIRKALEAGVKEYKAKYPEKVKAAKAALKARMKKAS